MEAAKLLAIFDELNDRHFSGALARPVLRWNRRLRVSAGRFLPGGRHLFSAKPPQIEVAAYLLTEEKAIEHVRDTIGHEMIHYWLWSRRRPYGHTAEFRSKMREMGVSRFNPIPRRRPPKYLYRCGACAAEIPARKRLGRVACARCCKQFHRGRFDLRFLLTLVEKP